ncbi:nucleotidyltransferase [Aliidongia dinghuensis]|uniref:Nucleotidyltransferase n=1 Tax=Aliidongia dinghuensis TaxID=1867774 RepID=A0A8J2YPG3_9PROT|nr:DNA polymerase Y family protein [Aliidongia dinghuensis]GGF00420.1 nucleotidyltransferase [Aliidongia dinghuensis]
MRRVVSAYLPTWPTDRLRRTLRHSAPPTDRPFATALHDGRRRIVAAVDMAARAEGLAPGMALAHARMLVPELVVEDADPAADLAGLHRLAVWCQRLYSPLTSSDPPDGIWLDVSGATHLWGSEKTLLVDLRDRLGRAGLRARVALADTPGAAHGIARHGREPIAVVATGDSLAATRGLPVVALRLPPDVVSGLRRLGFETIADLMKVPRSNLALRFGSDLGRRLDQLSGLMFETLDPVMAPEAIMRRVPFVEPISTADAIKVGIERLVGLVRDDLDRRGLGARRLDLICERVDGEKQAVRAGMARPSRDPKHLIRLLEQQVERIDPGYGIEAMVLAVPLADPLRPEIIGSMVHREPDVRDVAALVDTLSNRLGAEKLFRAAPVESDIPDRSWRSVPPLSPPTGVSWPVDLLRPSRLLAPPEMIETTALLPDHPPAMFSWRGDRYRIGRVDGPERIFGEWWRADREVWTVRDYFAIEDELGARYWIFRTGIDNAARWFMHGLF